MTTWRSRIVETGTADPRSLIANPRNWRKHPKTQADAISGVLGEVGWVQDVIVNRTTGRLVDGHLRVEVAIQTKQATIPVTYVDLSEAEEALILATFDPISAMANADAKILRDLLDDVSTGDAAVQQMIADLAEREGVLDIARTEGLTDTDDVPEPPVDPITRYGDMWILGNHRLICGDATNAADVAKVLAGATPELMVTDPPYGISYDPRWHVKAAAKGQIKGVGNRGTVGFVANDDRADWTDAWRLSPCSVAYVWHASLFGGVVQASLEAVGYELRSQIIWAKHSFAIGRGHYHWQHETAWYAVRTGKTADWIGDRSQATVWKIDKVSSDTGHGTQKPIECMARPIANHGGDVFDPFLGSGTTLIAAEQAGRRCYGLEIDPAYCDVIVNRWESFTGKTAVRETAQAVAD